MARSPDRYETSAWTGEREPDPTEARLLFVILLIGAIGFLIIGAAIF
ncbi:MAG TPA: hypothetical protein VNH64_04575 [Parvularculaceae bacterium]|nr:hypothetical protein [Parvularculaceae bacterium]